MENYLEGLNKAQYEAATTIDGALLIIAGAGTGKTKTLVSRIAYMLKNGISARNILLLTFTNKAAKEMKIRIEKAIGKEAQDITASTFHSFCSNFLRIYARMVDLDNAFAIMDETDAMDAMDITREGFIEEMKDEGYEYDLREFPSNKTIFKIYSQCVNAEMQIDDVINGNCLNNYKNEINAVITRYKKYKKERNLVDCDDLLYYTKLILNKYEKVRSDWDERFQYCMVDEYQDTNRIQDSILDLLTRDYKNVAVVGDGQQSIYKFRFADVNNIFTFEKRYPGCRTIALTENYRSSQEILNFANEMMAYVKEGVYKDLHGQFHGEKPVLKVVSSNYEEAEFIVDEVMRQYRLGAPLKSMAVIIRSSMQSNILEVELNKQGIPYEKFGGKRFLEKPSIKDVLSYLRVTVNEKDELALFRILQLYPGIGKGTAKKIADQVLKEGFENTFKKYESKKYAKSLKEIMDLINSFKNMTLAEQINYMLDGYYFDIRYNLIRNSKINEIKKAEKEKELRTQVAEIQVLKNLAVNYKTTEKFLEDLALDATLEKKKENDHLNVTTIHSAKGLEYDTVFLMDTVQGIFPKTNENLDEDAEEMRCMYVAVTRAINNLYLIFTRNNLFCPYCDLSHFINKKNILKTLDVRELTLAS